jgi:LuxR family transcriptional regulator, maltose regulon positive regulatory protein
MAMWLAMDYEEFRGELAVARGWRQRARRLLDGQPISAEHGWLPILECWAALQLGEDPQRVKRCAAEAIAASREGGDADIEIVAIAMEGLAMVGEGRVEDGMKHLGEAAASVLASELQEQLWATAVFCFVISAFEQVRDFGRVAEWCETMHEVADRIRHRAHAVAEKSFPHEPESGDMAMKGRADEQHGPAAPSRTRWHRPLRKWISQPMIAWPIDTSGAVP